MLEVVEHQEHLPIDEERLHRVLDRLAAALVEGERLGDGVRQPLLLRDGRQRHEAGPSANSPATARAASSASRVLPVPPAPVAELAAAGDRARDAAEQLVCGDISRAG